MNDNLINAGIETDRALADILSNFSEDVIDDTIMGGIRYRFRPFSTRMANYPQVLKSNFEAIALSYTGTEAERIRVKASETYYRIIEMICITHRLEMNPEIPEEALYPLSYYMFQIFISEYTDRILDFFVRYIQMHAEELINGLSEESRVLKSSYAKKVYKDPLLGMVYDSMEEILDIIASLDIRFEQLMSELANDQNIADFICSYIVDTGDVYKNFFASLITNDATRTDVITYVKIKYMESYSKLSDIYDASVPVT